MRALVYSTSSTSGSSAGSLDAVAEESDLFLFLPMTPQKAVPAPMRHAKLAPEFPFPKWMPGPRSKKNQGSTFSLA